MFSRYLGVKRLWRKGAETLNAAFIKTYSKRNELILPKKIMVRPRKRIFGDEANFCEDVRNIYYQTYSETKVAVDRRAIQTLKNLICRYLEENDTLSYIKDLQLFVDVISSRINRRIGLAPKGVANFTLIYKRTKIRQTRSLIFK